MAKRYAQPSIRVYNATLPAAGAEAATTALQLVGATHVTLFVLYTRGAAGGRPRIFIEWDAMGSDAALPPGAGFQGVHIAGTVLSREYYDWPVPPTAAQEKYTAEFLVPAGMEVLALRVAEIGVIATPGDLQVYVVASSEE